MRKNYNPLKLLALLGLGLSLTLGSGCGLRDMKRKQQQEDARENAEFQQELQQDLQQRENREQADAEFKELEQRIGYLRAVEGEFHGEVRSATAEGRSFEVTVRMFARNLPAEFSEVRPLLPSEVEAFKQSLLLRVELEERGHTRGPGEPGNQVLYSACAQPEIKPDYEAGWIDFSCDGGRSYTIHLDESAFGSESADDEAARVVTPMELRAREVSEALIEGNLSRIDDLTIVIRGLNGRMTGKLRRTGRTE